jgi:hypothetical protein
MKTISLSQVMLLAKKYGKISVDKQAEIIDEFHNKQKILTIYLQYQADFFSKSEYNFLLNYSMMIYYILQQEKKYIAEVSDYQISKHLKDVNDYFQLCKTNKGKNNIEEFEKYLRISNEPSVSFFISTAIVHEKVKTLFALEEKNNLSLMVCFQTMIDCLNGDYQAASNKSAFSEIEKNDRGIPFSAIRFLHNKPHSKMLTKQIIKFLNSVNRNNFTETALWYAVVAENHLSPEFIDPVINLFIEGNDWDFLHEQASVLIGLLAKKYPKKTLARVMEITDKSSKTDFPYLYLFDAFYSVNIKKYKTWLLEKLQIALDNNSCKIEELIIRLATLGITEVVPAIKKIIATADKSYDIKALKHTLKHFKNGKKILKAFCEHRGNWEKHYYKYQDLFYENSEDTEKTEIEQNHCDDFNIPVEEPLEN